MVLAAPVDTLARWHGTRAAPAPPKVRSSLRAMRARFRREPT